METLELGIQERRNHGGEDNNIMVRAMVHWYGRWNMPEFRQCCNRSFKSMEGLALLIYSDVT
jgi:hypothetical protein